VTRILRRYLEGIDGDHHRRYLNWISIGMGGNEEHREARRITGEIVRKISRDMVLRDDIDKLLRYDQAVVLEGNMLPKIDMMSMMNSLEVRSPFMDYRVVEIANNTGSHQKIRYGKGKYILRQIAKESLPAGVHRRPKRGFDIPIGEWLKKEYRELFWDETEKAARDRGISLDMVQRVYREHAEERADRSRALWAVLTWCWWWNRKNRKKAQ
jgi:asparagine synthase (glutamine-hydrolysing)